MVIFKNIAAKKYIYFVNLAFEQRPQGYSNNIGSFFEIFRRLLSKLLVIFRRFSENYRRWSDGHLNVFAHFDVFIFFRRWSFANCVNLIGSDRHLAIL